MHLIEGKLFSHVINEAEIVFNEHRAVLFYITDLTTKPIDEIAAFHLLAALGIERLRHRRAAGGGVEVGTRAEEEAARGRDGGAPTGQARRAREAHACRAVRVPSPEQTLSSTTRRWGVSSRTTRSVLCKHENDSQTQAHRRR